jgi:hypothetical protein
MTTRTSVAEKIRTGLILFVALAALVFSFVIDHALRPPGSEATSMGKRIPADAGIREDQLTPQVADSGADDAEESQP